MPLRVGKQNSRFPGAPMLLAACLISTCAVTRGAVGTWTSLSQTVPSGQYSGHLHLLSDGSVMVQWGGATNGWNKLSPDLTGHYGAGGFGTLAAMSANRQYYSSQLLPDGQLLVAGGEYGNGTATAELYDPVANAWTGINPPTTILDPSQNSPILANNVKQGFIDSGSIMLPDGRVLVAPVGANYSGQTIIYDPNANTWANGATLAQGEVYLDEASWVKLPDDSILVINPDGSGTGVYGNGTNVERYIPSLQKWIPDAAAPAGMYSANQEMGAAFLLPDGRAFFLGGNGTTAFYTPSGSTNNGTWTRGTNMPSGLVARDTPAAMMPNGKILCALTPSSADRPIYFYEFDPVANIFTQTASPTGGLTDTNQISDATSMLDLPDGTILYDDTTSQLYIYTPNGSAVAAGKPAIQSVKWNGNGSLHFTGTLFNGISQGASFGDDNQMDSNYPLIRFNDGSGNVYYGRTLFWSSTGVQTGGNVVSTECVVPGNVFAGPGAYTVQVVANGISSDPLGFPGPVWVDFNYTGSPQLGTFSNPFGTLAQGVSVVASGATILIKPGLSHETMTISKPMTITSINGSATIGQ